MKSSIGSLFVGFVLSVCMGLATATVYADICSCSGLFSSCLGFGDNPCCACGMFSSACGGCPAEKACTPIGYFYASYSCT